MARTSAGTLPPGWPFTPARYFLTGNEEGVQVRVTHGGYSMWRVRLITSEQDRDAAQALLSAFGEWAGTVDLDGRVWDDYDEWDRATSDPDHPLVYTPEYTHYPASLDEFDRYPSTWADYGSEPDLGRAHPVLTAELRRRLEASGLAWVVADIYT